MEISVLQIIPRLRLYIGYTSLGEKDYRPLNFDFLSDTYRAGLEVDNKNPRTYLQNRLKDIK
jgi:hypothetical protein